MMTSLAHKTLTLLALVDPICMVPIFLKSAKNLDQPGKLSYARALGLTVLIALLTSSVLGQHILTLFDISIHSMQISSGAIALLMAIAMVVGHAQDVRVPAGMADDPPSVVPLGIPLLVGPGALAFSMGYPGEFTMLGALNIILPAMTAASATWLTFWWSTQNHHRVPASMLDVLEKVGGLLLAAIAMEMMLTGLKGALPGLVH